MIAALLITSGRTSTSSGFDPYKRIGYISAVQRMIMVMQRSGAERVALVTSEDTRQLVKHVTSMGVVFVHNDSEDAEMLCNVKAGLEYLDGKCEKVFITPVNFPLFSEETVRKMSALDAPLVIPEFLGQQGHPIMVSGEAITAIMSHEGCGGLSAALSGTDTVLLPVEDEGILYNARYQKDMDALASRHTLSRVHPDIHIALSKEKTFFDPTMLLLLELIKETESLSAACSLMGISYSKGWNMVGGMEKQLGRKIVSRHSGGKQGGKSVLLAEGMELIENYKKLLKESRCAIEEIFMKYFGE